MNILEVFKQSYASLMANKIRSFLTLLALVIGVFSVIVSTTAVAVLDNFFTETMSVLGSDVVTIQRNPAVQIGNTDSSLRNRKRITYEEAHRLEELMVLGEGMSPMSFFTMTAIKYKENETEPDVSVQGGNSEFFDNNSFTLEEGRNFTEDDLNHARKVVVIGKDVERVLFPNESALDKNIRIDGQSYLVIAVLEKKGQIFGQSFDNVVVIPYTAGINKYGSFRDIGIQVRAPAPNKLVETVDELTGLMRVIRKVAPGEANSFEIITNDSLSSSFDAFTGILYLAGFVVGGITLFGAGIGVMNIMLVSVTERTREIGIRKAVGAPNNAIVSQFLAETIFICQIGGLIGLVLGIATGNIAAILMDTSVVIPVWSIIISFFGMILIGIIFGVYPAFKAAKLDPIESLRYE